MLVVNVRFLGEGSELVPMVYRASDGVLSQISEVVYREVPVKVPVEMFTIHVTTGDAHIVDGYRERDPDSPIVPDHTIRKIGHGSVRFNVSEISADRFFLYLGNEMCILPGF